MKDFKKIITIITFTTLIGSCSTNSAATENLNFDLFSDKYIYLSPESIVYASSISNLIATFPRFRNEEVNKQVSLLKNSLTSYLESLRELNNNSKRNSLRDFKSNYKKIQKLRNKMANEENLILNRYLVKIKTNINLLEASQSKTEMTSDILSN